MNTGFPFGCILENTEQQGKPILWPLGEPSP